MMLRVHREFDMRTKSRLLVRLENGEQAALLVERGRLLRGGDRVQLADGREVEIVAAVEQLLQARSTDPLLLVKAAYHLGNRHVAVQFLPDAVRFLADHVLGEMVAGLGLTVSPVTAPFEPEGGAYGHSHAHAGEGPPSRPKIHTFSKT
jgi:urease accessory protein